MESQQEEELGSLSGIYDALRNDAKVIIHDLRGGVSMWREAAAANLAAACFLLILALTTYQSTRSGDLTEGAILIVSQVLLAVVLLGYAVLGFRKYFRLKKKYAGLFERAKKLD